MTAVLYFRRCDRILTLVFVRNERVAHIFFQYPDVPTAMLDLLKLAPLYHTVDTGRLELHDLADLLDGQHRRILPVIAFQRFLCRITRHKKPPLRRKRKHNSVDVSYSVFKLLFADHRGQRTSSVGYFYAQKNDVLLAAPPRSEEKLPTAYRCLYENRRNGTGIVRDVLGSTRSAERTLPTASLLS